MAPSPGNGVAQGNAGWVKAAGLMMMNDVPSVMAERGRSEVFGALQRLVETGGFSLLGQSLVDGG
jgi:hypothetical protein